MTRGMLPLDELTHAELYALRAQPGVDQDMLAPAEHRAFAREFAQESPMRAAVSLPFAIPAYTAAKALGLAKGRSPASFQEVAAGYRGLLEGLGMLPVSWTIQQDAPIFSDATPPASWHRQLPLTGTKDKMNRGPREGFERYRIPPIPQAPHTEEGMMIRSLPIPGSTKRRM